MSKYNFLDELILVEALVCDLNTAMHSTDSSRVEYLCREMKNSASRILRKVQKYEDFYDYAEAVSCGVHRSSFLNFDKGEQE